MAVANTLACYDTATITAVKSFIVQAPVVSLQLMFGAYDTDRQTDGRTDRRTAKPHITDPIHATNVAPIPSNLASIPLPNLYS